MIVLGAADPEPAAAAAEHAGAAAGAYYDTGVAIATDGRHVSGVAKIIDKPGEIGSWVGAGMDVVCDGCCGIGAAGLNNLAKEAGKTVAKEVAKEAGKTVAKQTTKQVLKQEAKIVAKAVAIHLNIVAATHAAAAVDSGIVKTSEHNFSKEMY